MRISLLLLVIMLFSGCGVGVIAPPVISGIPTQADDAWKQVEQKIASKDATISELQSERNKEAKVIQDAQQKIKSLDVAINEARERQVARWLYVGALLCGVVAVGALVLFFVFPAFGSIERGLAFGCGVSACVLWWLGAHVHALPWIGGSVVLIGACGAVLKLGTVGAIIARLRGSAATVREMVGHIDTSELRDKLSQKAQDTGLVKSIRAKFSKAETRT
jgi:hypothetical protein